MATDKTCNSTMYTTVRIAVAFLPMIILHGNCVQSVADILDCVQSICSTFDLSTSLTRKVQQRAMTQACPFVVTWREEIQPAQENSHGMHHQCIADVSIRSYIEAQN